MGANRGQIAKIWAGAKEIGIEEPALRDLVEKVSGNRSISALSFAEAGDVIDHLVSAGARKGSKPSGRRMPPGVKKLLTGDQRSLIQDLREKLGGKWTEDRYFEGACRRVIKKPRPTTAGNGARVIEMLKRRLEHEKARAK